MKVTKLSNRGEKQSRIVPAGSGGPQSKDMQVGKQLPLGWGPTGWVPCTPSLFSFPSTSARGLPLTPTAMVTATFPQSPNQGRRPDLSLKIKACPVPCQGSAASQTSLSH